MQYMYDTPVNCLVNMFSFTSIFLGTIHYLWQGVGKDQNKY